MLLHPCRTCGPHAGEGILQPKSRGSRERMKHPDSRAASRSGPLGRVEGRHPVFTRSSHLRQQELESMTQVLIMCNVKYHTYHTSPACGHRTSFPGSWSPSTTLTFPGLCRQTPLINVLLICYHAAIGYSGGSGEAYIDLVICVALEPTRQRLMTQHCLSLLCDISKVMAVFCALTFSSVQVSLI